MTNFWPGLRRCFAIQTLDDLAREAGRASHLDVAAILQFANIFSGHTGMLCSRLPDKTDTRQARNAGAARMGNAAATQTLTNQLQLPL